MHVVDANLPGAALKPASHELAEWSGAGSVIGIPTDVSDFASIQSLKTQSYFQLNAADVLMNNAGVGKGGGAFADMVAWWRVIDTNLWGVIHGIGAFASTAAAGTPGLILNTGYAVLCNRFAQ